MAINPRDAARIHGKEPFFTIVFIVIVAAICYAIFTTVPAYIKDEEKRILTLKKELQEKRKSEALNNYQKKFDQVYLSLETSISDTTFPQPSKMMDEVRQMVKDNRLKLVDLSRSGGGSNGWVNDFLEKTNVVEINLIVQGDINSFITFLNHFMAQGPYRRVLQMNVSLPSGNEEPKYAMSLLIPVH